MDISECFLSRRQVHEMTGWSLGWIDANLPRRKVGGKVLIPRDALNRWLRDPNANPLFVGEASPYALGYFLQIWGGSPHQFGSSDWKMFGETLVKAFKNHVETSGLDSTIRDFAAAWAWSKTDDAVGFFDANIPPPGRGKEFVFV